MREKCCHKNKYSRNDINALAQVILVLVLLSLIRAEHDEILDGREKLIIDKTIKSLEGWPFYNLSISEDYTSSPKAQIKIHSLQNFERRTETQIESDQIGEVSIRSSQSSSGINVLLIQTDQQRYDMIGSIQSMLPHYEGKTPIRTPNLDALMRSGTTFTRHYVQSTSCGPSRTTMRTGCTIERTGVQTNTLVKKKHYSRSKLFLDKVNSLVGFDQVLTSRGYNCEVYGKWHVPTRLKFMDKDNKERAVRYDSYDFRTGEPLVAKNPAEHIPQSLYRPCLAISKDQLRKTLQSGEQMNTFSRYPYTPVRMDVRYGKLPGTKVKDQTFQIGRDSLSRNFTASHCQSIPIPSAMERLVKEGNPWLLDISYKGPHPPLIATGYYFDRYWEVKDDLFIPPSTDTKHLKNSPYHAKHASYLDDPEEIKEFMVSYYALIEEVDYYIGEQLNTLESLGQRDNTLVIFTSDHGDQLGAHGKVGKKILYEESVRVPMILSLPGQIPAGQIINIPTSSIDLFSTILDYTGSSESDSSDGESLRRFIDSTNMNEDYDHEVAVAESDFRNLKIDGSLDELEHVPHLMVVKGDYKLMISKSASASTIDLLFNLKDDPFEMENLVGLNGLHASEDVIGKAEHLKALAVEWMERMDGPSQYYSDPVYNDGKGMGYVAEVNARRSWKKLPIWVSDTSIDIGMPVFKGGTFKRREYLYLGRSSEGVLNVSNIKMIGADGHLFKLGGFTGGKIKSGEYRRVQITYRSKRMKLVKDAQISISHDEGKDKIIELLGYEFPQSCINMDGDEEPNTYGRGTKFLPGDFICLGNNRFGLTEEGKIVYMIGPYIAWKPGNSDEKAASVMYMQRGGQLVAYDDNEDICWSSNWPSGSEMQAKKVPGSILIMKENGAVIKSPENVITWKLEVI